MKPPPLTLPAASTVQALQQRLLAWFATAGRDLPWRHTRDPYRILVSEMMLQQTQVDRVLPRYAEFLQAFPTLHDLAAAPTAEVIKQWAGLGYNRRAVNLQKIARIIRDEHGGVFPQQVEALRRLPGIGPYTAGALACFAFEQDSAFVDTNMRRVLLRLLHEPHTPPPGDQALLPLAEQLIPPGQGWSWNQALMELGALICTTRAPACWRCPLQPHCRAYAAWQQADENLFAPAATAAAASDRYPTADARPARRVAERRAAPFVGSNRYYRGRLLDVLRGLPPGEALPLARLGPLIKADFDASRDQEWLHSLAAGLQRDGLAHISGDSIALPGT